MHTRLHCGDVSSGAIGGAEADRDIMRCVRMGLVLELQAGAARACNLCDARALAGASCRRGSPRLVCRRVDSWPFFRARVCAFALVWVAPRCRVQRAGGFHPSNSSDEEMSQKLIDATTRPCPKCAHIARARCAGAVVFAVFRATLVANQCGTKGQSQQRRRVSAAPPYTPMCRRASCCCTRAAAPP
jgi:hypothetical protein